MLCALDRMRMVTVRVNSIKDATLPMQGACPPLKTSNDSMRVVYCILKEIQKLDVMTSPRIHNVTTYINLYITTYIHIITLTS